MFSCCSSPLAKEQSQGSGDAPRRHAAETNIVDAPHPHVAEPISEILQVETKQVKESFTNKGESQWFSAAAQASRKGSAEYAIIPSLANMGVGNKEESRDGPPGADAIQGATASINEILRINLGEVKLALQKLASVSATPSIALNEAAELLCKHLSVSLCSITGYTDNCTSFILLSAYGSGANELERFPVMKGPDCSHTMLLDQPSCLHFKAANQEEAANLPIDYRSLYNTSGLCSFLSIPIATDHEVIGSLTIAKEDPEGFEVDWWEPMLGCLSMGLLPQLRNEQTYHICQLMKSLDAAPEYVLMIHQLLRGAQTLLLRAKNTPSGCRLALVNNETNKALVFEPDRAAKPAGAGEGSASGPKPAAPLTAPPSPGASAPADPQIHVTEIQLENTLLLDAVQKGKARFVSDCASYIQSCMKPATDVFISGHEMVASIVVIPLIYEGKAFGGFYVTLESTSNFQNIKDLLMGFINTVVLVLQKKLSNQREQIWDSVLKPANLLTQQGGQEEASMIENAPSLGNESVVIESGVSDASNRPVVVQRSCTEAMLKVLQHEIRRSAAITQALEWIEELTLTEVLGKGGFGIVYKGTWKGSVAAIKVMYARQHERQAMKDALEMALLTSVSHPFIIHVYSCFTDMVEDATGALGSNGMQSSGSSASLASQTGLLTTEGGKINVRFRKLQPDEDRALATCNILVMEYCDRASLRHAMKKGVFHKRLDNTSVAVDLCAVVQVLIEVAQAIQHLHSLKLIHCDIKPENVLLKSDSSKSVGFSTKLSDFGLAKILRENYYIVNRSGSGTVTHLAPELFRVGSKLTTAVDAFSFGIMMWEVYTGQRAYGGLGRDAIIDRVYKKKARPIFPLGVPPVYAALAKACWDNDSTSRPNFITILSRLSEMLTTFSSKVTT